MSGIVFKELSYAVIGAAMEVHRELGPGYLEKVYQWALAHEFTLREIAFEEYKSLPVWYKGIMVGDYQADFIVERVIVVEIKAVSQLHPRHEAQALNYLTATRQKLAILLNFGKSSLKYKRLVN